MCFEEACARLPRAESSKPMKDPYSMQLVSEAYGLTPVGSKPKRKPVWVNVNKPGKVTVGIENTSNDTIRDMMIVFLLLAVF